MEFFPAPLEKLVEQFARLPGIGAKSAQRLAFYVLGLPRDQAAEFSQAILDAKDRVHTCPVCQNLTEGDGPCAICSSYKREKDTICVVAEPKDVIAMEKTGEYKGVYHVLNGLISTTKGVMPEDLNLQTLLERAEHAREIILATNTTLEGETTAMYLNKLLASQYPELLVTRIAHGLPSGGLLDYADEMTLAHAMSDRRKM